jgi:hypothetical protein
MRTSSTLTPNAKYSFIYELRKNNYSIIYRVIAPNQSRAIFKIKLAMRNQGMPLHLLPFLKLVKQTLI